MGPIVLPSKTSVNLENLQKLNENLNEVYEFWKDNNLISGVLVSVHYNKIIAKSNRICGYLNGGKNKTPNDSVVGAKFSDDKRKHIITHYVDRELFMDTLKISQEIIDFFKLNFPNGILTEEQFNDSKIIDSLDYTTSSFAKTKFKQYLRDSCFIECFSVEKAKIEDVDSSLISFFDISKNNQDIVKVLQNLGINVTEEDKLDDQTILLDENYIKILFDKAPYLVSMAVKDFTKLVPSDFKIKTNKNEMMISEPNNEPIIGVIDTLYDKNVYFNEWVEYEDKVDKNIPKQDLDFEHGTAITSLIVDGPSLNPNIDDGCGRFRAKHFGISLHKGFNSFTIVKQIQNIVEQNRHIKVWNLSLGSNSEIKDNFISAQAALLDQIQHKWDVIFVIAGTNGEGNDRERKKIGAPADSINSVTVSSVDFSKNPTSFTRKGEVLSFFVKEAGFLLFK